MRKTLGHCSWLAFAVLSFSFAAPHARGSEFVWIEGESAVSNNMTRHPWWYEKVKKGELSGGDFIANWSDKQPGEAAYTFEAPADKEYTFWVRANPIAAKLSYQLDASDWKLIDVGAKSDENNIAEDGKPDMRFIAWLKVGAVTLTKGSHNLKFKMHSENNNHGMLDCFVFADASFTPSGGHKPGEKVDKGQEATGPHWAFEPAKDMFSPDALLDLRGLNEKIAGENGFVTRSKDGNELLLGNGKPARFWAVNTGAYNDAKLNLERHAQFLAKRGINMVRFHGNITPGDGKLMDANREEIEKLWRCVAAMKKAGVYTTFSPYWAGPSSVKASMGVLDPGKNGNWGMLFFDKKLQEAYRAWMKTALTEKNPHTGIPLSEDPALAIIQLQNEDSLLFYTSQGIAGSAAVDLRKQFGEFLAKKYGSLDKAKAAWDGLNIKEDNFAAGEAGLYMIWELTQRKHSPSQEKRLADQMQFYADTMFNFNKMAGDYIHNELHCKALINAGNWRTADNVTMLDSERYSYTPNEIMGVNRYYTGEHDGPNAGWAICNGDMFTDDSVLLNPRDLPVALKQVDGYPILISESSWVPPLSHQSEGPFLIAAYQSMNGVGPYYWFATGNEDWRQPGSANGFMPSEGKWVCATPMLMGQWPAAALFYRMGYVKKGEPAVYEQRALNDLWERKMPIIAEDAGYDPNRDKDNVAKASNVKGGVDPLAYLVGPVMVKYGGDPAQSKVADLKPYIDSAAKTVKSSTGELEMDYGKGICTLNTPKVQGVSGFLKKVGVFKLADVEIQCANEYATVIAVSMDDKSLKSSAKILVQIGTTERPAGWATKAVKVKNRDGEQVVNFGRAPWQITDSEVTITVNNPALTTACILDANGMSQKEVPLTGTGGMKQCKLPPNALYVVLK